MLRCKNCGRTVWEQIIGAPGYEMVGTGNYFHHHNGSNMCFPYQVAEVDEDNPSQEYIPEPQLEVVA